MDNYSKEQLFSIVTQEVDNGTNVDDILNEVKSISIKHDLYKQLSHNDLFYFVGKNFVINSTSWQVADDDANGEYTIMDVYNGRLICQNNKTGKNYLIDKEDVAYLITYEDYQDYVFIYVGVYTGNGIRTIDLSISL